MALLSGGGIPSEPVNAVAVSGGITFTFGGLKVGTSARVIDTSGCVIEGQYAAGPNEARLHPGS